MEIGGELRRQGGTGSLTASAPAATPRVPVSWAVLATGIVLSVLGLGACTPDHELSDAELYAKYCSKCHGEDGRGNASLLAGGHEVDLLSSRRVARRDREFIERRIAYGYGQMPAYIDEVEPETLERLIEITLRMGDGSDSATDGKADPATDAETGPHSGPPQD